MILSALTPLVLFHTPASAQDGADPYAALRAHRSCQSVLPPLATPDEAPPESPPLCDLIPTDARCVAPHRNRGAQKRPTVFLDPELDPAERPPTPPYTTMYTPGIQHVFGWLKSLNTCRFQAGSAVKRPEEPTKGEFETAVAFAKRMEAHSAAMARRASAVVAVQKSTEPLLDQVTFVAVLPVESLGVYDARDGVGCFFPGVSARIELDEFKSRDTIYETTGEATHKYRLVPRKVAPTLVTDGSSGLAASKTLARAYFDEDTPTTDIVFESHPLCIDAVGGHKLRAQRELNNVADFGIHFEAVLRFKLVDGPDGTRVPEWVIGGEFVQRDQAELVNTSDDPRNPSMVRADRSLQQVSPGKVQPPPDDVPEPDPSAVELPIDDTGPLGCSAVGAGAAAWWLSALLLGARRRRA